jgi:O-antigen/teichoic acid export membrane protein
MARKLPFPEGTYSVAAGIGIAGITAYAFLSLAYRQLVTDHSKAGYTALFGLWVILYTICPGFFQPLEQEVGRAIASRRAQGIGAAPLVKRAATLGGFLALGAIIASFAALSPLSTKVFHHHAVLFVSLIIGIVAYYVTYVARGTLAGNGRFGPYGTMVGAEGAVRLLATAALFLIGVRTAGIYGLAIVLPPIAALLISMRGQKHLLEPGPEAPYSELSTALGWLLLGSVLCQAISYAAYIAAVVLAKPSQTDLVGDLATGILIARIPLLGFQAVQAALLPKLARLAGAREEIEFRKALRQIVMIVLAVGLVGVVGGFAIGQTAGRILFGTKFTLSNVDVGLLALGSGAFMLALTLAQALIALRSYAASALSWVAGVAGCVVGVVIASDLYLRAELSYAIGSTFAAVAMLGCLVVRLRSGSPLDAVEQLATSIREGPLEVPATGFDLGEIPTQDL